MDAFRTQGFTTFTPTWRRAGVGEVPPASTDTGERGSPPSSYAVLAVLEGQSGALLRLFGLTLLRGCFIVPGMWVASKVAKVEMDGVQLVSMSLAGSATISAGMIAYYWIQRRTQQ